MDRVSERALMSKVTWRLIPFMFLLYIVAYLDRVNVSFAGLDMQKDLHFSDAIFGMGMGACLDRAFAGLARSPGYPGTRDQRTSQETNVIKAGGPADPAVSAPKDDSGGLCSKMCDHA